MGKNSGHIAAQERMVIWGSRKNDDQSCFFQEMLREIDPSGHVFKTTAISQTFVFGSIAWWDAVEKTLSQRPDPTKKVVFLQ